MNEKTEKTTLVFVEEINYEIVATLINLIEDNAQKQIDLYFCSDGGGVGSADILTDYFKYRGLDLTLIANWSINSSAFSVFFASETVNRRIMPNAHAVIHLCRRDISTIDLHNQDPYKQFLIEDVDRDNQKYIEFITKLGVDKDKIEKVKQGEDVILDYEELSKLL